MTGTQTSEIDFVHHKSHMDWPGIQGLVVTRFTHIAPGLTKKAWHFVHTATVSPHSIHCLQVQCSVWDMNWILIQQTDVSLQSVNTEQVWQALWKNKDVYCAYCLKREVWKCKTTKLFTISWDSSVSTVTTLRWIPSMGRRFFSSLKCPADCGQPVCYSMDARDSFTGGKVAGVWSWPLTIK